MTLEETKEQISQLETKLSNFKQEKHELFHKLKIVLYQDETRRKREDEAAHHNANLYLQPNARNVPGMSMRMGHTQLLIQQAPGNYEYTPQLTRNLKKSRPKKLVKSNKSISRNFFLQF